MHQYSGPIVQSSFDANAFRSTAYDFDSNASLYVAYGDAVAPAIKEQARVKWSCTHFGENEFYGWNFMLETLET